MSTAIFYTNEAVNFCISFNIANEITHASTQEKENAILSHTDDTYVLGRPKIAFLRLKLHDVGIALIGFKLKFSNTKCYTGIRFLLLQE